MRAPCAHLLQPKTLGIVGEAHRLYTRRINFREKWRGYLWQGRFASFVMDEPYLIAAARYVELNPVRANCLQFAFHYVPMHWGGGDLFDVLADEQGNPLFFVSDVSGHGVGAALITAMFKTSILGQVGRITSVVDLVNRLLSPLLPRLAPISSLDGNQVQPQVQDASHGLQVRDLSIVAEFDITHNARAGESRSLGDRVPSQLFLASCGPNPGWNSGRRFHRREILHRLSADLVQSLNLFRADASRPHNAFDNTSVGHSDDPFTVRGLRKRSRGKSCPRRLVRK
jgi:hypothetical protein